MKLELPTINPTTSLIKLKQMEAKLESSYKYARDNNIKHNVYQEELSKRHDILNAIVAYKQKVDMTISVSQDMAKKYRESRISFLENEIEKNLEFLLPDEKFKIKIDFRTVSDRHYADLYIGDGDNWSLPKSKNGRFIRQIISFTAMYSVNKLRGSQVIFYDEALSSADATSLTELKDLLMTLVDEGFQIIMIEHKPELYNNLSRKEIHLHKDRIVGNVQILKEEIIDGESNESDSE